MLHYPAPHMRALEAHYESLFALVRMDGGMHLAGLDVWNVPVDPLTRSVLFSELWRRALVHRSTQAYHALCLHTPDSEIGECLCMAVAYHDWNAVYALAARLKRMEADRPVITRIHCSAKGCSECKLLRQNLVAHLPEEMLAADFALVRAKLLEARRRNLYEMWRPILLTSSETDVVTWEVVRKARQRWTQLATLVVARALWRRFVDKMMEPGSRYVRKLGARFASRSMYLEAI